MTNQKRPSESHAAYYQAGYLHGLMEARRLTICAPVLSHGQRFADMKGGFPRVLDRASDPDGNPNLVQCEYALRDGILFWLDERIAKTESLLAAENGPSDGSS